MLKCIHRIMGSSKRAEEVAGAVVAMNGMRKRWRRKKEMRRHEESARKSEGCEIYILKLRLKRTKRGYRYNKFPRYY